MRARLTAGVLLWRWREIRGFVGFRPSEDRAARKKGATERMVDAIVET